MKPDWNDVQMSEEDYANLRQQKNEARFLDFVAMLQIGVDAIHEARDLRGRLVEAEERAARWQKLTMDGIAARDREMLALITTGCLRRPETEEQRAEALAVLNAMEAKNG